MQTTLQLFDTEQLRLLYGTGKNQLEELGRNGHDLPSAWTNLALLENAVLETADTPMN